MAKKNAKRMAAIERKREEKRLGGGSSAAPRQNGDGTSSTLDWLDALPRRATTLDKHAMVAAQPDETRARLVAYFADCMPRSPELGVVCAEVLAAGPELLRVKELLETVEAFRQISRFAADAAKLRPSGEVARIYDVCCGHGLLGCLLAYRFPRADVICCDDTVERPALACYRAAFAAHGEAAAGEAAALTNLRYERGRLRPVIEREEAAAAARTNAAATPANGERGDGIETGGGGESACGAGAGGASGVSGGGLVLVAAVHACNEANVDALACASACGAAWAVMTCCIRDGLYFPCGIRGAVAADDDARHLLQCGAIAGAQGAERVNTIDRRITNRNVLICGGAGFGDNERRRAVCRASKGTAAEMKFMPPPPPSGAGNEFQ